MDGESIEEKLERLGKEWADANWHFIFACANSVAASALALDKNLRAQYDAELAFRGRAREEAEKAFSAAVSEVQSLRATTVKA